MEINTKPNPGSSHLTLSQAAKVAPGRPSSGCLWRWCRKGVQARDGQRVKLEHIRIGGKIFTTGKWVEDFGRKLAEADALYFDRAEHSVEVHHQRKRDLDLIDEQLDASGL